MSVCTGGRLSYQYWLNGYIWRWVLRTLFIHGARAVVRVATNNNDGGLHQWVNQLKERRGFNKTTVAVANKNARIIWSMLRNDTEYQAVGS